MPKGKGKQAAKSSRSNIKKAKTGVPKPIVCVLCNEECDRFPETGVCRFWTVDDAVDIVTPTCEHNVAIHRSCGMVAIPRFKMPQYELIDQAGIVRKYRMEACWQEAIQKARASTLRHGSTYYLLREFEAHLRMVQAIQVDEPSRVAESGKSEHLLTFRKPCLLQGVLKIRIEGNDGQTMKAVEKISFHGRSGKHTFPPLALTHTAYSEGILVNGKPTEKDGFIKIPLPLKYFKGLHQSFGQATTDMDRPLPALNSDEAQLWCHRHAATTAANFRFPVEASRLVGTITLHLDELVNAETSERQCGPFAVEPEIDDNVFMTRVDNRGRQKLKNITKKSAHKEAAAELGEVAQGRILKRADKITRFWQQRSADAPSWCRWDMNGGFEETAVGNDKSFVTVGSLRTWLNKGLLHETIVDCNEGRKVSLYNGLQRVPIHAKSIVDSLMDLSDPNGLYRIPLVMPYILANIIHSEAADKAKKKRLRWEIRIGVYVNRLLPEVLTLQNLHVVMSALDHDSYIVNEPIHLPPMRSPDDPVFQSSPYPTVVVGDETHSAEDRSSDATIEESTRNDSRISAFTTRGLLRLLENHGNDISEWPRIKKYTKPLKLDLMLHQIHAICWMMQMESLRGFGINSMIWEEREFLDGGKYYYSPALGQLRLDRPPVMNGGLLVDEMGLGKTIEIIGLILATLETIKKEASLAGNLENGIVYTPSTLIIVPPALLTQWTNEIKKTAGDAVSSILLPNLVAEPDDFVDRAKATDIVIATYDCLRNKNSMKIVESVRWGRIVLDEMQEIRSSTTSIARMCAKLVSSRRWMLSGTPLFEGVQDLQGELNFLQLSPYASSLDDGFFEFSIMDKWNSRDPHALSVLRILGLLMLRRAKNMTLVGTNRSILDLKPLTVEFVPVPQEDSERALYCWMEHLVSRELSLSSDDFDQKPRNMCLRLLRELCISPILINGGLGAASQMRAVNNMMVRENRREVVASYVNLPLEEQHKKKKAEKTRVMSCSEALRFLTQVRQEANVSDDFISEVSFGGGGGMTVRSHALVSVEDQYREAELAVNTASQKLSTARRRRALILWHLALEKITTGCLLSLCENVKPKFYSLWKWRHDASCLARPLSIKLPTSVTRGWRPSPSFISNDLFKAHREFAWARPYSCQLSSIPGETTMAEVRKCVIMAIGETKQDLKFQEGGIPGQASREVQCDNMRSNGSTPLNSKISVTTQVSSPHNGMSLGLDGVVGSFQRIFGIASSQQHFAARRIQRAWREVLAQGLFIRRVRSFGDAKSSAWNAVVQFPSDEASSLFMKKVSKASGVALSCKQRIPQLDDYVAAAKDRWDVAKSRHKVHPSVENQRKMNEAKREFERSLLGLRVVSNDTELSCPAHILASQALGPVRTMKPQSSLVLFESVSRNRHSLSQTILGCEEIVEKGKELMSRLSPALDNASEAVRAMSAYETLEALANGEHEKTRCPICFGAFGSSDAKNVAMTKCGHFFCVKCLDTYAHERISNWKKLACPNCRKEFSLAADVVHIDPDCTEEKQKHNDMREAAIRTIKEASEALEKSNGQLDANLWHALFMAIDPPVGIPRRGHPNLTAIPWNVLAHFRAATGMEPHQVRSSTADRPSAGRSTKIRMLLRDLPRSERSVVFTSCKEGVRHLSTVLSCEGIACRTLFVGQHRQESQDAVTEWTASHTDHADPPFPVLIVQAGAAASGLTLTAASKMFFLEPFIHQEEEQQAYARCHRYGQQNHVHVKCYYAPVSVESRLLDWRKKAQTMSTTFDASDDVNEHIIYSTLEDEEMEDTPESQQQGTTHEDPEGTRRSLFLLGLVDEHGNSLRCNGEEMCV